eukprot:SAG22_NODE_2341_length_2687_cov_4.174652_1_plen_366_part_00
MYRVYTAVQLYSCSTFLWHRRPAAGPGPGRRGMPRSLAGARPADSSLYPHDDIRTHESTVTPAPGCTALAPGRTGLGGISGQPMAAADVPPQGAGAGSGDDSGATTELALCRICFSAEGDDESDELFSPCACTGSQKHIHRKCLQRWQRSVLRSHSAQPARDASDDDRHAVCNVCKQLYSCGAPTREQLLAEDLGVAIVAPIGPAALLVARNAATALPAGLPVMLQAILTIKQAHWRQSVYLIIDEIPADAAGAEGQELGSGGGGGGAGFAAGESPRAGLPSGPAADGYRDCAGAGCAAGCNAVGQRSAEALAVRQSRWGVGAGSRAGAADPGHRRAPGRRGGRGGCGCGGGWRQRRRCDRQCGG